MYADYAALLVNTPAETESLLYRQFICFKQDGAIITQNSKPLISKLFHIPQ